MMSTTNQTRRTYTETVPPQKFEFQLIELSADQLALDCTVDGVHPKPLITFSEQISSNHSFRHHFPVVNVTVSYRPDVSLYRASFRHPVRSVLSVGTIYECRLELPGTNYVRKKRIKIIFPTSKWFTLISICKANIFFHFYCF